MSKEILAPEVVIETSRSFDGLHELTYNDKSHRYKLDGKPVSGFSTISKAGYPTSVGLTNWMKTEAMKSLFNSVSMVQGTNYIPRPDVWPISEQFLKDLLKLNRDTHEEVAQQAADIGTICHAFAEYHSVGKYKAVADLLEQVKGVEKWPIIESCINKYQEWAAEDRGELVQAEGLVASPTHMFCGKFDRLDKVGDRLILRDYKTSKSIYPDQYIQLAGYAIAIKEWLNLDVQGIEVLRFGKEDGAFENLLIDDPKEIQMFKDQAIRCRGTFEFKKIENDERFDWKKKTKKD
jgi:hypothetical protein